MLVRPIEPSDEDAYRAILEATTPEDRYCRFFHRVDHFDAAEIRRFVETRADTLGVIAFDGAAPLGAAHAVLLDAETAELAIVVGRGARHDGVGTALLDALVVHLRERGVLRLVACALRENRAFEHLARHAGFVVDQAEGAAWHWTLPLTVDLGTPAR
ncbi:MAG TPA: GNAT family N-acetyltransferase [Candidatus Elarobacter sp.]|jgi:GNAT superfamily N-acetyltransferase